ncbi:WYL domain-containing protein [Aeribacillus alveayuensis]|jgi:predicted DNA-binding transcriptional regulator YafY|uniref:DNA-binding transcriptional regulator YafY n=1 Tax=Aeribacillus alveayuensis TaxID=279215 RepID=A0ABT9VMM9_9BACI|nr:putative DNA-binding transcriptional regulator YafY [Bacillus alveayuensis]
MTLLENSFHEKRPIEIIYLAQNGELSQRTILVKSIHSTYIRAYCFQKRNMRTFRKDSILSIFFMSHTNIH